MVFLAQAIVQSPKFLLLDEPTIHLDIQHKVQIFKLLKDLNKNRNLSVLVISHDINIASQFCRQLILLSQGNVVTIGTPKEVITEENISKVYGIKTRVVTDPEIGWPIIYF